MATNYLVLVKEASQVNPPRAHSKRSEQWIPVHAWLESLDKKEIVRSKEISDWLSENPLVKEHLYARYSRYHLMHYVQKCHSRMLKRREKGRNSNATASENVEDNGVKMAPTLLSCNSSSNFFKYNDLAKRNEALHKYELLTELEDRLSIILSKSKQVKDPKEFVLPALLRQRDVDTTYNHLSGDKERRTKFISSGASCDEGATATGDLALDNN